jgi:hypothetical protein
LPLRYELEAVFACRSYGNEDYDNYDEPDDREPPRSWGIIRDPKSYRMTRR